MSTVWLKNVSPGLCAMVLQLKSGIK